jgi:hypothetical protein
MVESLTTPTFYTLGPGGTDHERATQAYIEFQGLGDIAELVLVDDPVGEGPERVRNEPNSFLVQCSAHREVHTVTERYPQEVIVVDDFIYATRNLSLLVRAGVIRPKTLGLVPATHGYTDLTKWENVVSERSKPVISERLLAGDIDAGITFTNLADEHPEQFHIAENYGAVRTTWLVYGHARRDRYAGEVIGHKIPWLFTGGEPPAAQS